jgi:hypothetical protein
MGKVLIQCPHKDCKKNFNLEFGEKAIVQIYSFDILCPNCAKAISITLSISPKEKENVLTVKAPDNEEDLSTVVIDDDEDSHVLYVPIY